MANTTWNPSDKTAGTTLTGSNLIATGNTFNGARGVDRLRSGKYYFEYTGTTWSSSTGAGVATSGTALGSSPPTTSIVVNATGQLVVNGTAAVSFGARANGDVVCFAFDFDGLFVWARIGAAGNWNNNAAYNPATGTGGISYMAAPIGVAALYPFVFFGAASNSVTANFGDSAFTGAVPSGFTAGFPSVAVANIVAATQVAVEQWASVAQAVAGSATQAYATVMA